MVIVEKSFPRGGVEAKEPTEKTDKEKQKIIFGAVQKKIKKSKTQKSEDSALVTNSEEAEKIVTRSAEVLNYETIQDGMNIMGIVKKVDKLFLTISLPGRMIARVSALQISEAYTKISQAYVQQMQQLENYKPLDELYHVGQIVYGHVMEIKVREHRHPLITMSLEPSLVHAELHHTNIKKGFAFNGAIEEIQEHGYIVETGIRGMRCFLPMEKSQSVSPSTHAIGELVFMKVDKITQDKAVSTCICKEVNAEFLKIKKQIDPNIDYILPSTIVQFTVQKRLKDGLQGTIMNDTFTAYVNEHQLVEPLDLPEDYDLNMNVNARVLYVMPLTKLVYLTLRKKKGDEEEADGVKQEDGKLGLTHYKRGHIIEKAKVHHLGTGGVVLILNNKYKGIISYKTIKANYKGNYDQDELLAKYAKKTQHKVRVLDYDLMDGLYICTDDAKVVNEKVFDFDDVQPGEIVQATVVGANAKIGGYYLKVGNLKGTIERIFLSPSTKDLDENSKLRCRVVAIDRERRQLYLTNRTEYMAKNVKLLTDLQQAKANAVFTGTLVQCNDSFLLVKFFNNIRGILYRNRLSGIMANEYNKFSNGQTMQFRVFECRGDHVQLTLPDDVYMMGEICPIEVEQKLESGLEIKVTPPDTSEHDKDDANALGMKALIPLHLLSEFNDLTVARLLTIPMGQRLKAACILKNIFSLRDLDYFHDNQAKSFADIKAGDILRAFVKNVSDEVIELMLPIRDYDRLVKVHFRMLLVSAFQSPNITLNAEQVVYVKVLSKETVTRTVTISGRLTDVWNGDLGETSEMMERYLDEVNGIRKALKKQNRPIGKFTLGEKLQVTFKGVDKETNDWIYEVDKTKINAIVKSTIAGKSKMPQVGAKQQCIILWIDYSQEILYLSNKAADIQHISSETEMPKNLKGATGVSAKVLLKLENLFICSLKKATNPLVYCPSRLHWNDFELTASINAEEGEFCRLAFINDEKPIAVLHDTYKLWKGLKRKRTKLERQAESGIKAKKVKVDRIVINPNDDSDTEDEKDHHEDEKPQKKQKRKAREEQVLLPAKKEKREKTQSESSSVDGGALFYVDKKPNARPYITVPQQQKSQEPNRKPEKPKIPSLPGVGGFFDADLSKLQQSQATDLPSSDDEDCNGNETSQQKKRKLTAAEKFKQQREEEARLRAIEEKLADPHKLPETVDQFDRLVLSDRNNSKNWINYMVFHLQSAEIDKARAVARRALKAIDVRNSEELLNMWVALLNLELRYGSKEQFDDTLKEALKYSEPVKVYLRVLDVLAEAQKTQELVAMIGLVTKKFRVVQDIWKAAASAYFSIGMTERAQQLLSKALLCLPEREHVNTIVLFANLNHKFGHNDVAHTLLDQVVTSYPKRVDVWTQYVDMLIKDNLIESARAVLGRAIVQKLPLKKMRTMFKKYLDVEERFGTKDDVEKVKKLAVEYVKRATDDD